MNHKKYMDIQRIKPGIEEGFEVGDYIIIQEKIDGANAAIRYDSETDSIVAQSRKNILTPTNNLRGFFEFTQRLDKQLVKETLGDNLVCFCEWLVSHTVVYPDDRYNNAYIYDVYDVSTSKYLPQDVVKTVADKLGITYVPVFYSGEFISWEHCQSFVGRTELGGDYGEGIVCKNMTKLNDENTRQPFYLKIVGEKFAETKGHKVRITDIEKLKQREEAIALTETIVTEARVVKILHKMVDDGVIPTDWGTESMNIIAKSIPRLVYEDCVKEEPEIVKQIDNFGKYAASITMSIVRKRL